MISSRSRAVPVLLLAAALCSSGCGRKEKEARRKAAEAPPPIVLGPEDTALVARGEVRTGPLLTGTLTAQRQAVLRAQIAGSVLRLTAQPGETVGRGAVLARLDSSALTDAYGSARAAVTSARSALGVARREAGRQRTLVAAGAVAQRDVEAAQQAQVAAEANLAQARSQLASAEKQLQYTAVTAPFAGVVSERAASEGDAVQPGTALLTVVDPSSLELEAAISAEELGGLRLGSSVTFTVTGYGDRTFRGRISRINPSADPITRQVRVYATLPNEGNRLVAGLYGEGRVESASRVGLVLPAAAIDRRMAKPAVLAVRDGKVVRIEVALGLVDDREQKVELRSGVKAGDVVLVGAAQEIQPGTAVQLAPGVAQQAERLAQTL